MKKKKLTKKWLQNHFAYSWWKYAVLVAVSVMGVNILFTSTQYRPPEEKKIEFYVLNDYADTVSLKSVLDPVFFAECPDQEELTIMNINLSGDDVYAPMQYSTYVAAQQGDVFLMTAGEAQKLAYEGADYAFVELTPFIEDGTIDPRDIDLSRGMMKTSTGEEKLYAIPADQLYGLVPHGNDPAGDLLCITYYGGNDVNAARFMNILIGEFYTEKPDRYDEYHEKREEAAKANPVF